MRYGLLLGLLFLAGGGLLLGSGLTGEVVSQSCCFPPDCPVEYWCDAAEPIVEQPGIVGAPVVLGLFLMSVGVLFLALDRQAKK